MKIGQLSFGGTKLLGRLQSQMRTDESLKSRVAAFDDSKWIDTDGAIIKHFGPAMLRVTESVVTITNTTHGSSIRIPLP